MARLLMALSRSNLAAMHGARLHGQTSDQCRGNVASHWRLMRRRLRNERVRKGIAKVDPQNAYQKRAWARKVRGRFQALMPNMGLEDAVKVLIVKKKCTVPCSQGPR
ncbi:hypothetical protein IE81DRAFT_254048 [Ceraceosorus guamensis]|uniref:Uncharacterized protein n=1 Tax=Ceraceosorus guamensis TaxID=1522189 RepID=A0A316W4R7_9BASI|nr:hypothetical protein IE81DRAFT_254048 [Ceraceosorus guamensis]PWN44749.1 hypothetical protein IE81DRAFT_254048 [Ceraceosorus guamensis]